MEGADKYGRKSIASDESPQRFHGHLSPTSAFADPSNHSIAFRVLQMSTVPTSV